MRYPKRIVDGTTVLVLAEREHVSIYALKASRIPIGVPFRSAGNNWGVIDLVPWSRCETEGTLHRS